MAAGIDTGAIAVTFLSDASGYLLHNPYSDAHEAPKQVKLYMDVSMTAENPEANGALSQTLLHVELNGMALVKEGRMEIDAVGIVEPKVLGQETAFGLLSFHMKSYEDQENAPQPVPDMTAPQLQSMVPAVDESGTALSARPGDAVILNFDEPLDPSSLSAGDTFGLQQDGSHVAVDWYLDGASLVMRPVAPLAFGESYTAMVSSRVTDLAGNPAVPVNASFNLPQQVGPGAPHRADQLSASLCRRQGALGNRSGEPWFLPGRQGGRRPQSGALAAVRSCYPGEFLPGYRRGIGGL